MISTKGRYALRVMIDLAEQAPEAFIPLDAIAARQGISKKYLESILKILVQKKLLKGLRKRRRIPPDAPGGGIYRWRNFGADGGHAGAGGLSGSRSRALPPKGNMQNPAHVDAF